MGEYPLYKVHTEETQEGDSVTSILLFVHHNHYHFHLDMPTLINIQLQEQMLFSGLRQYTMEWQDYSLFHFFNFSWSLHKVCQIFFFFFRLFFKYVCTYTRLCNKYLLHGPMSHSVTHLLHNSTLCICSARVFILSLLSLSAFETDLGPGILIFGQGGEAIYRNKLYR